MARNITRRKFVQLGSVAGAALAISGCTINLQRSERLEPFVIPPEDALPGESIWYASTCLQCPAGCGIVVRTSNGRASFIAGNPKHPLNQGKLCARGQAGLQVLYNPDRLQNAVSQAQRGSRSFVPLYWEQALMQVADRVKAAKPGAVAFYGSQHSDSLAAVAGLFLKGLGAPPPVIFDPLVALEGRRQLAGLTGELFGSKPGPTLPFFDLAQSDVVFSFGADFTETWLSPVAYGRGFGAMRGGALGQRGYLVQFEPRMSAAGAVADQWVPISPGTEGQIALALGKLILDSGRAKDTSAAGLFRNVDVTEAAASSGIPVSQLGQLAAIFVKYPGSTAIPGGAMAGHTNAAGAMTAVLALNSLVGRTNGKDSAFSLTPPPPTDAFSATNPSSFADVQKLIERMDGGGVEVLFIHGNPLYDLPAASGIARALGRVPFVVSCAWIVDETAVQSDLILPDDTYLESWGYQTLAPSGDRPALSGQQPVVSRLYDTRATTDVFMDLAQRLGGAVKQAVPWLNTVEYMKTITATLSGKNAPYSTKDPEDVWAGWRQYGGWWPDGPAPLYPSAPPKIPAALTVSRPRFEGEGGDFPYILYPYLSVALSDGRGASQSWLQETPDPMVTGSWGTWVELNPETAAKLGVQNDDLVKIIAPHGEIVAIVYLFPAIRPDVVAVPLGQGHSASGRYAANVGANIIGLLPAATDESGNWVWGSTRVKIEVLTGQRQVLPRIENNVGVEFARQTGRIPG